MLSIIFKTESDYNAAKDFFRNESNYYADSENDEFLTLSFEEVFCSTLEHVLTTELVHEGIENFYFESH